MKNLIVQIYCSLEGFSEPGRLRRHDEIKDISSYLAKNCTSHCHGKKKTYYSAVSLY